MAPDDATDTAVEEASPPALTPQAEDVLGRIQRALGDAVVEHGAAFGDAIVRVKPEAWRAAGEACKAAVECDYLSFISGIDWMPAPVIGEEGSGDTSAPVQPREQTSGVAGSAGRFQLLACVESTRRKAWQLLLKTDIDESTMRIDSWVPVYPGADWHEREAWEMYGFTFEGHPSLRHLYLPSEFEGHPLRKDYPLLAREVKPWPGLVDVEGMPGEPAGDSEEEGAAAE